MVSVEESLQASVFFARLQPILARPLTPFYEWYDYLIAQERFRESAFVLDEAEEIRKLQMLMESGGNDKVQDPENGGSSPTVRGECSGSFMWGRI